MILDVTALRTMPKEQRLQLTAREIMLALGHADTETRARVWIEQIVLCDPTGVLQPDMVSTYTTGAKEHNHHIRVGLPGKQHTILRASYSLGAIFFDIMTVTEEPLKPAEPFCDQVRGFVLMALENAIAAAKESAEFIATAQALLGRVHGPAAAPADDTAGAVLEALMTRTLREDRAALLRRLVRQCDTRNLLMDDLIQIFTTTSTGAHLTHVLVGLELGLHRQQVLTVNHTTRMLYHDPDMTKPLDLEAPFLPQLRPGVAKAVEAAINEARDKQLRAVQTLDLLARVDHRNS